MTQKNALLRIDRLRRKIDVIDRKLLRLLQARFKIAAQIGKIKIENGLPLFQRSRWMKVLRQRTALARSLGIDRSFGRGIFAAIHAEALRIQQKQKKQK